MSCLGRYQLVGNRSSGSCGHAVLPLVEAHSGSEEILHLLRLFSKRKQLACFIAEAQDPIPSTLNPRP